MVLDGFRLLDLTQGPPGATCTHLLADMGMEVIRVQAPRGAATDVETADRAHDGIHRNKRSIVLNLREPAARDVLYKLASSADAVLESFRPGVTGRLGIDHAKLQPLNPRLIYVSISGYGQDGPYAGFAAHDAEVSAGRGAWAQIGDTVGTPGFLLGTLLADGGAGLHAALAIVSALLARAQRGAGQYIDVSLADCVSTFQLGRIQELLATGANQALAHRDRAVLECKDGKYLIQSNVEPQNWERFCQVIGRPDLLGLPQAEGAEKELMLAELRSTMLTRTRDEWFYAITAAGASAGPCLEMAEVLEDSQVRQRGLIWELDHPTAGAVRQWGSPMRFSDGPATLRNFAPAPGQDSGAILQELGYSESEQEALKQSGALGERT